MFSSNTHNTQQLKTGEKRRNQKRTRTKVVNTVNTHLRPLFMVNKTEDVLFCALKPRQPAVLEMWVDARRDHAGN